MKNVPYTTRSGLMIGSKYVEPERWAHTTQTEDRVQSALLGTRPPQFRTPSRWVLFGPMLFMVLGLALVQQVKARHEERKAITAACLATQDIERGNPAACRFLFANGGR